MLRLNLCCKFNFMELQLLKLENQSKSPEFAPASDKIKRNLGE